MILSIKDKEFLMSKFKLDAIVVYKDICHANGFFGENLFQVKEVQAYGDGTFYYEVEETLCKHSNRKRWGSDGSDIRHAFPEEIEARCRLPKVICCSKKVEFVNKLMNKDIWDIVHYEKPNYVIIKNEFGYLRFVDIIDIQESK